MTFAKQIETVAIAVYVYSQTRDALALGWLGLVQAAPVMVLAIPAGQMADRRDRRLVLAAMVSVTTIIAAGLTVSCYLNASAEWIYLLLCISAVGQALGGPSRASLLPQLVPAEGFSNAVTWNSSVFHIASMVGPATGGVLVATTAGVPLAMTVVVLCRVLSLAGIAMLPSRQREVLPSSISLESLMAGVRFVRSQKPILATITLDLFAVLLGGATYLLPYLPRIF